MAAFRDILAATSGATPTIVLSEGADPRVAEAAVAASVANLAKIICIGDPDLVEPALSAAGSAGSVAVEDPANSPKLSGYIEHISADSVTENENSFYIIRVRTESNEILFNGKPLKIIPGMNAKVDIITGNRSVLNSILRPVLRGTSETLGVS